MHFQEMELSSPKELLLKLSYTLNKTPPGQTDSRATPII